MPTYEYRCQDCDCRFEYFSLRYTDKATKCDLCGSENIKQVLQPVGFQFKDKYGNADHDHKNRA